MSGVVGIKEGELLERLKAEFGSSIIACGLKRLGSRLFASLLEVVSSALFFGGCIGDLRQGDGVEIQ